MGWIAQARKKKERYPLDVGLVRVTDQLCVVLFPEKEFDSPNMFSHFNHVVQSLKGKLRKWS